MPIFDAKNEMELRVIEFDDDDEKKVATSKFQYVRMKRKMKCKKSLSEWIEL